MDKSNADIPTSYITSDGQRIKADRVSKRGQSTIVKCDQYLYIIRFKDEFVMPTYELELTRRKKAVAYATQKIPKYLQETRFVDLKFEGENCSDVDTTVIARRVPWLADVKQVCDMSWNEIKDDREIIDAIAKISLFTIKTVLIKGRLYDLFRMFKDVRYAQKRIDLMSMISPNIMCGRDSDGKRVLFVDADWYITLADVRYTGYPRYQYIRRFTQGSVLLVATVVFFSLVPYFNFLTIQKL